MFFKTYGDTLSSGNDAGFCYSVSADPATLKRNWWEYCRVIIGKYRCWLVQISSNKWLKTAHWLRCNNGGRSQDNATRRTYYILQRGAVTSCYSAWPCRLFDLLNGAHHNRSQPTLLYQRAAHTATRTGGLFYLPKTIDPAPNWCWVDKTNKK